MLIQQIAAEIGSHRLRLQKKNPEIKTTEDRPRKYYYTGLTDSAEIYQAENVHIIPYVVSEDRNIKEEDLYPVLSEFLWRELKIHSKRINDKRSSNSRGSNGNKWLHPDLVGMENLSHDWHTEIGICAQQHADKKAKLWSFEVKVLINRSNVREAFFQTVSNSSWANFGYLVAREITGTDTLKELRILSNLHGIGLIKLDAENLPESQIMIPAKERSDIDWNTANSLAEENKDFLNYIKLVRQFYQTGGIRAKDWDFAGSDD